MNDPPLTHTALCCIEGSSFRSPSRLASRFCHLPSDLAVPSVTAASSNLRVTVYSGSNAGDTIPIVQSQLWGGGWCLKPLSKWNAVRRQDAMLSHLMLTGKVGPQRQRAGLCLRGANGSPYFPIAALSLLSVPLASKVSLREPLTPARSKPPRTAAESFLACAENYIDV